MSLHTLANKFRTQLKDRRDSVAQTLTDAHAQTVHQMQPQLDETYKAIEAKQQDAIVDNINNSNGKIPLSWLSEGGRLDALKRFIAERIDHFSVFAKMTVQQVVDWAHSLAGQAADLFIKTGLPDTVVNPVPQSIVSKLLNGTRDNLASLFGTFGRNAAKGIEDVLTLALTLGDRVGSIAESIKTVLDEPRWRSIAIVATEMFRIFGSGLMSNYHANKSKVVGWWWCCRLSDHSCIACISLHGTYHTLDETLEDHVNGECVPVPYISGMEPPESGIHWFEQQGEERQRKIFGTTVAYDTWKAGTPLSSFIGIRHDPGYEPSVYQRSVKQIKKGK